MLLFIVCTEACVCVCVVCLLFVQRLVCECALCVFDFTRICKYYNTPVIQELTGKVFKKGNVTRFVDTFFKYTLSNKPTLASDEPSKSV